MLFVPRDLFQATTVTVFFMFSEEPYSSFSSLFAPTFRIALKEKDVKTVVVVYVGH